MKSPQYIDFNIFAEIDTGTAAGIYGLRRLKAKHCAESVGEARSVLDFCLPITQNVHP